jgi:hypothetical protein
MQSRAATSAIRGIRKAQIVREETQLAIAKPLYKPRDRIGQGGPVHDPLHYLSPLFLVLAAKKH